MHRLKYVAAIQWSFYETTAASKTNTSLLKTPLLNLKIILYKRYCVSSLYRSMRTKESTSTVE